MHSQNISRKEMIMDMDIVFASNLVVEFKVKDYNNGKQSLKLLFPRWKEFQQKSPTLASVVCSEWFSSLWSVEKLLSLENSFSCNSFIHRSARYRWSVEFKLTSWRFLEKSIMLNYTEQRTELRLLKLTTSLVALVMFSTSLVFTRLLSKPS